MDIAKIRKKAKEKEGGPAPEAAPGPQSPETAQETAPEAGGAGVPSEAEAGEEEILREETAGGGEGGTGAPEAPPAPAAPPAGEERGEEIIELLTFTLAQEEFAFRVPEVEEIIRFQKITRVPTMPGYVCGITSLRGKIIPVIDLKARLILREGSAACVPEAAAGVTEAAEGADAEAAQRAGKILILAGPQGLIGATIGRVLGVVRFPREKIFEPPSHLSEEELQFIEGVVTVDKRFISIIRAEAALTIDVL